MKYSNIIGIDISKDNFVVAVYGNKTVKSYNNNPADYKAFYNDYKKLTKTLIVMENTGGYEQALASYLTKFFSVHIAPGKQIKDFIRSFGKYGKTDKIDAIAIANYGYERQETLRLYNVKDQSAVRLKSLISRSFDLKKLLVQEKNRYKSPSNSEIKNSINRMIESISLELKTINQQTKELIAQDESYSKKVKTLQTISGIGESSSAIILALVPELGKIDRRQIASLCGLAPHPKQSGKSSGYAHTIGGRRAIRPTLYLCAMAASRSKTKLGEWYKNLIANGKKPIVALVALMRKIIVIANAKLRDLDLGKEVILGA
jgi:transposase